MAQHGAATIRTRRWRGRLKSNKTKKKKKASSTYSSPFLPQLLTRKEEICTEKEKKNYEHLFVYGASSHYVQRSNWEVKNKTDFK